MASSDQQQPRKDFRTLGLDIKFPFEPYGIQKSMMNKVTLTLMNKEHSLIESPTGTGKTLVLLCSSLAWLKRSQTMNQPFISTRLKQQQYETRRQLLANKPCTCGRRPNRSEMDELRASKENMEKGKKDGKEFYHSVDEEYKKPFKTESAPKKMKIDSNDLGSSPYFKKEAQVDGDPECIIIDDDDEGDDAGQKCQGTETENKPDNTEKPLCRSCAALQAEDKFTEVLGEDSADCDAFISNKIKAKIPRIYYGTRTHKQITQVVRELNKTDYKNKLRMCILSSRERTCINEDIKDLANKNDRCQELIKNSKKNTQTKNASNQDTCSFYRDSNTTQDMFEPINDKYIEDVWDIEDAAAFGKEMGVCPYYGVRSLQEKADITFSPYNYLLDPAIRSSMNINLHNSIVILDEAHNIEDICRESASFVINTRQLDDLLEGIVQGRNHCVPEGSTMHAAYTFFRDKLYLLKGYLTKVTFNDSESDGYLMKRVLTQSEMRAELNAIELGADALPRVKESLSALKGGGEEEEDGSKSKKNNNSTDDQHPSLNYNQMQFLSQLALTMEFMYKNNGKYFDDFRTVVTKTLESKSNSIERYNPAQNSRANNRKKDEDPHVWQFSLLCMNSGIAFEKIHSLAWSVIVASGTLSPIESLKSELGCQFANVFEGVHVINQERIFASIVSYGPRKVDLNCAYANSQKLEFQDEVGFVVRDVCQTVPNGVLCFFPSYDRMEAFYQRWFARGIILEIQKSGKKLFRERKNLTPIEFERDLKNYHSLAKRKGALLFAVYRGKVSEGIDFADDAARAVITIGIPYPNYKEMTVGLKKNYNDTARSQRPHLMSGGDWYASQAFRALNQALGRCIRHKEDWGAIIMIDSRLNNPQSLKNISKWMRKVLDTAPTYAEQQDKLVEFVQERSRPIETIIELK